MGNIKHKISDDRPQTLSPAQTRVKKQETRNKTVEHIRGVSSVSLRNKRKPPFHNLNNE